MPMQGMNQEMKNTLALLTECAQACQMCAAACLSEKDILMLRECIRLDMDCADLCAATAALVSRGSSFHGQACGLCADVCEACAAECGKHTHMDHCRECADACRRCAEACRSMAAAMA